MQRSCGTSRHRAKTKRKRTAVPQALRKHADVLCVLAKAKPKLAKQLIAGAEPSLVKTLSQCSKNVLRGNLPLNTTQKRKLSRYANSLRTLSKKSGTVKKKKVLLMKGGFAGALAGVVAPLLLNLLTKGLF